MTEPKSLLDPFALLGGVGARLERALQQLADRGVRSDSFARGMHGTLGAGLSARKLARQWQGLLLQALNLPARSDVLALHEKLQALEDRVIALAVAVERLKPGAAPSALPSPPRTRKPAAAPAVAAQATPARKTRRAKA